MKSEEMNEFEKKKLSVWRKKWPRQAPKNKKHDDEKDF